MNGVKHIHNVIKTLGLYPTFFVEADTDQAPPYLVVNLVMLEPYSTKGDTDTEGKSRVQVSVYGRTFSEVMEIETYIRNVLDNTFPATGPAHQVKFRDITSPIQVDNNPKTFFSAIEFEVLHDLNVGNTVLSLEDVYNFSGDYLGQLLVITES